MLRMRYTKQKWKYAGVPVVVTKQLRTQSVSKAVFYNLDPIAVYLLFPIAVYMLFTHYFEHHELNTKSIWSNRTELSSPRRTTGTEREQYERGATDRKICMYDLQNITYAFQRVLWTTWIKSEQAVDPTQDNSVPPRAVSATTFRSSIISRTILSLQDERTQRSFSSFSNLLIAPSSSLS